MDLEHDLPVSVMVDRIGDVAIVRVSGELDLAGLATVQAAFDEVDDAERRIVLDLANLEFIDSVGLTLTLQQQRRARAAGREFVVAGVPPPVFRVFEIAGIAEHLQFAPDVRAAL